MTRSSNAKVFTPFANLERKFQNKKNVKPIAIHNIYSFYETESSKSESEDINEIDIETLTLEQYRTLSHKNTQVRIKRLEIGEKDAFEIKSPLLRELRDNTLSEKKSKDVMEHLRKEQLSDDWEERLGNPRLVNMVIEIADRSVQSPKGIVKNVLVKSHKFIFSVDFVILDIIKDDKVPIIQGRPMLATTHARIDVFGGKISVEVGKEEIIFNANQGATPVIISHVCVIKDFDVIDNFGGPDNLEQLLMDDDINGDLGNFLQDNDLLPDYEDPGAILLSRKKSPGKKSESVGEF
ncbi:putative reverse transcriptase domain-containing protein [Tanacetum coccineum]|uniref:Reverse transcriptase domain-containing protein n=1 Tax=Tanacetum coccineum TaxID=301880 RepID=A0ABQ5BTD1_9ASTR